MVLLMIVVIAVSIIWGRMIMDGATSGAIALAILGVIIIEVILLCAVFIADDKEKDAKKEALLASGLYAKVPKELKKTLGVTYQTLVSILETAGFSNITCVSLHDCRSNSMKKNKIKSVTYAGKDEKMEVLSLDTPITITYHGE